jgi:predicted dehydrogenase
MSTLKVGLIGLDTSHVPAFTELLNKTDHQFHVPGGKVVVGYPGGSPDFDASINRVEKFTAQIRDTFGVKIVQTPEEVAQEADLVIINAVDGRVHRALFEKVAPFKKPVFIDKPFATTYKDANRIAQLAKEHNIPVMTSSSLRYFTGLVNALKDTTGGDIVSIQVHGPMELQPTQPGLFWYGCHSIEMMVTAMGAGCKTVRCVATDTHDHLTAQWADGRLASFTGFRGCKLPFGGLLYRKAAVQPIIEVPGSEPYYASLLKAVFASLPHGKTAIPIEESLDVVRIMEAGNISRANNGQVVELASLQG